MAQLFMRFPGGKAKVLTLSYDDGVEQDITLIEILNKWGIRCTFNLNSGNYPPEDKIYPKGTIHRRMPQSATTRAYAGSGHEIAVHALTHAWLEQLPISRATYEVIRDRENLESQFGVIVRGMAYPYGTFSDTAVEALKACGIVYARNTVSTRKFDLPTDWLRMPATCHHKDAELMSLAEQFVDLKPKAAPKMFYLWGHSYEFERDGNWDVIERFCEYIAGRDDIWYATNIEIYEYIEDFDRLIFSADGRIVRNPTARTLEFEYKKELRTIAPGGTLMLE